jgi:hypothetical protein
MFISYENEVFEINNSLKFSSMLSNIVADVSPNSQTFNLPTMPNVTIDNFKMIIEFMNLMPGSRVFEENYDYSNKPNKNVKLLDIETDFIIRNFDMSCLNDTKMVDTNINPGLQRKDTWLKLWELLVCADYMGVPMLSHVLYRTCANMLKGLDTQQMRDMLGIVPFDDRFVSLKPEKYLIDPNGPNVPENRKNAPYGFTPEEEAELDKKLEWAK